MGFQDLERRGDVFAAVGVGEITDHHECTDNLFELSGQIIQQRHCAAVGLDVGYRLEREKPLQLLKLRTCVVGRTFAAAGLPRGSIVKHPAAADAPTQIAVIVLPASFPSQCPIGPRLYPGDRSSTRSPTLVPQRAHGSLHRVRCCRRGGLDAAYGGTEYFCAPDKAAPRSWRAARRLISFRQRRSLLRRPCSGRRHAPSCSSSHRPQYRPGRERFHRRPRRPRGAWPKSHRLPDWTS